MPFGIGVGVGVGTVLVYAGSPDSVPYLVLRTEDFLPLLTEDGQFLLAE